MAERPRFWYPPKIFRLLVLGSGLLAGSLLLTVFLGSRVGARIQWALWGIGLLGVLIGGAGVILGIIDESQRKSGRKDL
jgi:hypothetical protein